MAASIGLTRKELIERVLRENKSLSNNMVDIVLRAKRGAFRKNAIAGVPVFQLLLGQRYEKEGNIKQAEVWYRKAAEQGYTKAQALLGLILRKGGGGVTKDLKQAKEWLEKAAKDGDDIAHIYLGLMYEYGECGSGEPDLKTAGEHFLKSAETGCFIGQGLYGNYCERVKENLKEAASWYIKAATYWPPAQQRLGCFHQHGMGGFPKDPVLAREWYLKSAKMGSISGQMSMVLCCEEGIGGDQDFKEAVEWLTLAANNADPDNDEWRAKARTKLGYSYQLGRGCSKDINKAVEWYKRAVADNDSLGQVYLGWCYLNGTGVPKDEARAVELFRKSAEQNDPQGQCFLAESLTKGKGVAQDFSLARELYTKAAEQGHATAQVTLALFHENGVAGSLDLKQAFDCFQKAATQGEASAEWRLGKCFEEGRVVERDLEKAVEWYTKSALQGDDNGQMRLAACFEEGRGVERDLEKAVEWYTKSALQGHSHAQYKMGVFCLEGIEVEQDVNAAFKWFNRAAHGEHDEACEVITRSRVEGALKSFNEIEVLGLDRERIISVLTLAFKSVLLFDKEDEEVFRISMRSGKISPAKLGVPALNISLPFLNINHEGLCNLVRSFVGKDLSEELVLSSLWINSVECREFERRQLEAKQKAERDEIQAIIRRAESVRLDFERIKNVVGEAVNTFMEDLKVIIEQLSQEFMKAKRDTKNRERVNNLEKNIADLNKFENLCTAFRKNRGEISDAFVVCQAEVGSISVPTIEAVRTRVETVEAAILPVQKLLRELQSMASMISAQKEHQKGWLTTGCTKDTLVKNKVREAEKRWTSVYSNVRDMASIRPETAAEVKARGEEELKKEHARREAEWRKTQEEKKNQDEKRAKIVQQVALERKKTEEERANQKERHQQKLAVMRKLVKENEKKKEREKIDTKHKEEVDKIVAQERKRDVKGSKDSSLAARGSDDDGKEGKNIDETKNRAEMEQAVRMRNSLEGLPGRLSMVDQSIEMKRNMVLTASSDGEQFLERWMLYGLLAQRMEKLKRLQVSLFPKGSARKGRDALFYQAKELEGVASNSVLKTVINNILALETSDKGVGSTYSSLDKLLLDIDVVYESSASGPGFLSRLLNLRSRDVTLDVCKEQLSFGISIWQKCKAIYTNSHGRCNQTLLRNALGFAIATIGNFSAHVSRNTSPQAEAIRKRYRKICRSVVKLELEECREIGRKYRHLNMIVQDGRLVSTVEAGEKTWEEELKKLMDSEFPEVGAAESYLSRDLSSDLSRIELELQAAATSSMGVVTGSVAGSSMEAEPAPVVLLSKSAGNVPLLSVVRGGPSVPISGTRAKRA